ncbi:MAG: hypothetical protein OXC44_02565 [Proteobacteria bacterium]|nr:hypothetical protein [Pseudomonadota bacterium]
MKIRLIGMMIVVGVSVWVMRLVLRELWRIFQLMRSELNQQELLGKNTQKNANDQHDDAVVICSKCGYPDGDDHVCKS